MYKDTHAKHSCLYTLIKNGHSFCKYYVYQYGKNVLYFFDDIAQRTLTEEWREIFRVDIELYHTALSQSAFRIYKCYIIKSFLRQFWGCLWFTRASATRIKTRVSGLPMIGIAPSHHAAIFLTIFVLKISKL